MLLVPTYLAPSQIHGIGVFAERHIAKGETVFLFDGRIDRIVRAESYAGLPAQGKHFIDTYCSTLGNGCFCLNGDNARFINHGRPSNLHFERAAELREYRGRAARDIDADEELTADYSSICSEFEKTGTFITKAGD